MPSLTIAQKTSKQFLDLQEATKAWSQHAKSIREAKASDSTLEELRLAKQQAAAEYKAESQQWDAKNEAGLTRLAELKAAKDEAHLAFTALYVSCVMEGEQLSLFDDFGAEIELVTKIKMEKRKAPKDTEVAEAD